MTEKRLTILNKNNFIKNYEKKLESFASIGINEVLANKIIRKGYLKTGLQKANLEELKEFLTQTEIDEIKRKIKRKPIPKKTLEKLRKECDWKCCICRDFYANDPVAIHHIKSYAESHDNSFDNLVILCLKHHGEAHTKCEIGRDSLPPELLRQKKEQWIKEVRYFYSIHTTSKTAVLHYSTDITIIEEQKIKKTFYNTEFKNVIPIACTYDLLKQGDKWEIERKNQERIIKQVLENNEIIKEFMLFSIHRIPLVIHLGYLFRDGFSVEVFQYQRILNSWRWQQCDEIDLNDHLTYDDSDINLRNNNENFILIFELSGKIRDLDIQSNISNYGGVYKISANNPSQIWLKYKEQVSEFKNLFYNMIGQIKRQNTSAKKFHIFYYGPTPIAFIIGQGINTTILTEVFIYNYDGSKYTKIFKIP